MENKELHILSRVVFPDADFGDNHELFYRCSENALPFEDGALKIARKYRFDTWMNLFAAKKWYDYCELGRLYLRIEAIGKIRVEILGHNLNVAFGLINETIQSYDIDFGDTRNEKTILIENAEDYDGISFNVIQEKYDGGVFFGASWCTDIAPSRSNTLAVITCTFKREGYIKKTIRKFNMFMQDNAWLARRIHLYVVDNGKTLSKEIESDGISIIPNMNAGGAGGFARGLMEANDGNYSRCILMDDDVEIFPETFLRTLILADYLKDKHKNAIVNGPMMSLYDKNMMFENLSIKDGLWVRGVWQNLPVVNLYDTLKAMTIDKRIFQDSLVNAAWWYASYSMDKLRGQYPMPVFFRGDDVEWGWRQRGTEYISMNGICIWHAPFEWRVGRPQDDYYLPRNMFFLNIVYNGDFKNEWKKLFTGKFEYLSATYNYVSLEIYLTAMRDILSGAAIYKENPETQFRRISDMARQAENIPVGNIGELEWVRGACGVNTSSKKFKLRKFIYRVSKKGMLLPKFLYRGEGWCLGWACPVNNFVLKKSVRVYNIFEKSFERRVMDKKKLRAYAKEFYKLLGAIDKKYDLLKTELSEAQRAFATREFWDSYLELKN